MKPLLIALTTFYLSPMQTGQHYVNKQKIIGEWAGSRGELKISMVFEPNGNAYSIFSSNGKKNVFTYKFISSRVIKTQSKGLSQSYYLEEITKDNLRILEYPRKINSEDVSILDEIIFHRKRSHLK